MRAFLVLWAAACVHNSFGSSSSTPFQSAGCGRPLPTDLVRGGSTFRDVQIVDPDSRLAAHWRQYKASVPNSYKSSHPLPLLFYFHGQGGSDVQEDAKFVQLGNQDLGNDEAFLVVSPKGMSDGAKRYGDCAGTSTAWNIGSAGRLDVCTRECKPAIHQSCLYTANVSNCNWATCYDDFHFFRVILASLKEELCIDTSRIYGTGVSNGAMMLYALTAQLPQNTFAAVVPWYGAFLQNMYKDPPSGTPLMHLHGYLDKTIPAVGNYADQYYYTTLDKTLHNWARINGCDAVAKVDHLATPWDHRHMKHKCVRFRGCRSGSVVKCIFEDQAHGFWPQWGEMITWWFMRNHSSYGAVPAESKQTMIPPETHGFWPQWGERLASWFMRNHSSSRAVPTEPTQTMVASASRIAVTV